MVVWNEDDLDTVAGRLLQAESIVEARFSRTKRSRTRWYSRRSYMCCVSRRDSRQYPINRIVDSRSVDGSIEYRVRWSFFEPSDDTWESAERLAGTKALSDWQQLNEQ